MTSQIDVRKPRLTVPEPEGRTPLLRAVRLAGATAIAVALALPAAAQQAPSLEPDTLEAPAAEGTGGTAGAPEPGEAVEAPTAPEGADTGTAGLAAPAEPDDAAEQPAPFDGQIIAQKEGTFTVSDLMGARVTGMDGGQIGKVNDVLMSEENQLDGLVISVGGFLGFGAKLIGVDISRALMVENAVGEKSVMLDLDLAELERAPEFISLDAQRRAAEEDAARLAVRQELENAGRSTAEPTTTE